MRFRPAIFVSLLFTFGASLPTTIFAQGSKTKKEATEEKTNLKESFQSLFKKNDQKEVADTREKEEDKALKASYKDAKTDVRAYRKERKASEAREKAARARAEAIKAERKASTAEKKAERKDKQAYKVRNKASDKDKKKSVFDKLSRKEGGHRGGNG